MALTKDSVVETIAEAYYQSVLDIAQSVLENVRNIVSILEESKLPLPGLNANAPSPDFVPNGHVELHDLRRHTVEQSRLLADTLTGPRKHLMDLFSVPNHICMSLEFVYHYRIPNLVPLEDSISFQELSDKTGVDEDRLTRLIKFVMLYHIFDEPAPGRVGHSAASKLLATEQASMDYLGHSYEDIWPACFHQLDAIRKAPHGRTVLDCGAAIALGGSEKSLFEVYADVPERMHRFSGAMQFINLPGSTTSISDDLGLSFDWKSVSAESKIVDVGGSQGHTARELLELAPNIKRIIVQDLPEVIEAIEEPDADPRIEFRAADFFQPQPIQDADIYLFRFIYHDWPNEKCQEILRNLVPSMKTGSKMVVNEAILHDSYQNRDRSSALISRRADLQMMVALNSKERSVNDWRELVESVTEALRFEYCDRGVIVFVKV